MQNNLIAALLRHVFKGIEWFKQYAYNIIAVDQFEKEIIPFEFHYTVDFRNASQIRLSKNCKIQPRAILNGRSSLQQFGIKFGEDTYIKENSYLDAYGDIISIGGQCAFAQNTIMHGGGGITIGKNVIFGANCYIIASNHSFGSRELPTMLQEDNRQGISIGNNVWLSGNVTVLDGVSIGDNCIVGAGTIVRKSIFPMIQYYLIS